MREAYRCGDAFRWRPEAAMTHVLRAGLSVAEVPCKLRTSGVRTAPRL